MKFLHIENRVATHCTEKLFCCKTHISFCQLLFIWGQLFNWRWDVTGSYWNKGIGYSDNFVYMDCHNYTKAQWLKKSISDLKSKLFFLRETSHLWCRGSPYRVSIQCTNSSYFQESRHAPVYRPHALVSEVYVKHPASNLFAKPGFHSVWILMLLLELLVLENQNHPCFQKCLFSRAIWESGEEISCTQIIMVEGKIYWESKWKSNELFQFLFSSTLEA